MKVKLGSGFGATILALALSSSAAEAAVITPHAVTPQVVQPQVVTHPAPAPAPTPSSAPTPQSAPAAEPVGSSYAPASTPASNPAGPPGPSGHWGETPAPAPRRLGETGPYPAPVPISTWYLPDASDPACSLGCLKVWAEAAEDQYNRDVGGDIERAEESWGEMLGLQDRVGEAFDPTREGPEEYFIRREEESERAFNLLSGALDPGLGLEDSPEVADLLTAEFRAGLEEDGYLTADSTVGQIVHYDAATDAGGTTGPPTASLDDFAELAPEPFDVGLGEWIPGAGPGRIPREGAELSAN